MAWLKSAKRWHPSIQATPEDCFNGLYISQEQLQHFDLTARELMIYQQWTADQQWTFFLEKMDKSKVPRVSREEFMWGVCIFQTRSASTVGDYSIGSAVILPIYDLINHAQDHNTGWFWDEQREVWLVRALRPIMAGEQITDNYGCRSNPQMMSAYGFYLPRSKCDHLDVVVGGAWTNLLNWDGIPDETKTLAQVFQSIDQGERFDANNSEHRRKALEWVKLKAQESLRAIQPNLIEGYNREYIQEFLIDRQDMIRAGLEKVDAKLKDL